jgi:hypothetical protein
MTVETTVIVQHGYSRRWREKLRYVERCVHEGDTVS